MRLSLPGPTLIGRHFYIQDRVPRDVLPVARGKTVHLTFGGKTVPVKLGEHAKKSLGTTDQTVAKLRYCEAKACLERAFEALRGNRPQMLTDEQVTALSGDYYRELVDRPDMAEAAEEADILSDVAQDAMEDGLETARGRAAMEALHGESVSQWLAQRGVTVPDEDRPRVLVAFNRAALEAYRTMMKRAGGDYSPDPVARRFPAWKDGPKERKAGADTLAEALAVWTGLPGTDDRPRQAKTRKQGARLVAAFREFLGHGDLARLTKTDAKRWTEALLTEGRSAKTVRDGHVAFLRSILNTSPAEEARNGGPNPFADLSLPSAKTPQLRDRAFTDDEAKRILRAALAVPEGSTQKARAKRWVALVQAHTGARVGEIAQLRRQDVFQAADGRWWIKITPEAGQVKTSETRDVPLHPQVVEWGFVRWAQAQPDGHLFFTPGGVSVDNDMRRRDRAGQHVADMVRALGIKGVQPTHGWRHRWKTVAREVGVAEDGNDAITGHSGGGVGRSYGRYPPAGKVRVVDMIPWYDLTDPLVE